MYVYTYYLIWQHFPYTSVSLKWLIGWLTLATVSLDCSVCLCDSVGVCHDQHCVKTTAVLHDKYEVLPTCGHIQINNQGKQTGLKASL